RLMRAFVSPSSDSFFVGPTPGLPRGGSRGPHGLQNSANYRNVLRTLAQGRVCSQRIPLPSRVMVFLSMMKGPGTGLRAVGGIVEIDVRKQGRVHIIRM